MQFVSFVVDGFVITLFNHWDYETGVYQLGICPENLFLGEKKLFSQEINKGLACYNWFDRLAK